MTDRVLHSYRYFPKLVQNSQPPMASLGIGAVSGAISALITNPLDVLTTRRMIFGRWAHAHPPPPPTCVHLTTKYINQRGTVVSRCQHKFLSARKHRWTAHRCVPFFRALSSFVASHRFHHSFIVREKLARTWHNRVVTMLFQVAHQITITHMAQLLIRQA